MWVSLVYTVSLSVSLVLVGRVTDIFGRRGFVSFLFCLCSDSWVVVVEVV